MTTIIPPTPFTGEKLSAAYGQVRDLDFETAAMLCGYATKEEGPDVTAFIQALLQHNILR